MKGNKIQGRAERTSEIAMHTTIYEMRPDIKSVVHAHPPVATGFATAGQVAESGAAAGSDHRAGLRAAGRLRAARHAGADRAHAAANPQVRRDHDGAITARSATARTFTRRTSTWRRWSTSRASRWWRSCWAAPKVLPREEVDKLLDSRTRYGVKAKSGGEPGCPVAAEDLARRRRRTVLRDARGADRRWWTRR